MAIQESCIQLQLAFEGEISVGHFVLGILPLECLVCQLMLPHPRQYIELFVLLPGC